VTHPEDVPRLEQEVAGFLAEGRTDWGQEYRLIDAEGRVRWIEDRNRVLTDDAGRPTHVQGVVLDVTERKEAELALRRSEQRSRAVLSSLHDTIVITYDYDGYVQEIFAGPEMPARYHLDREDFLGRSLLEIFGPEVGGERLARLRSVFETGQPVRDEYAFQGPTQVFWHDISLSPILDENGRVSTVVGFIRDVTQRRQVRQALAASEQRLRAILSSLHETFVVTYDADGRLTEVFSGPNMTEKYGVSIEDHIGRTLPEIFGPELGGRRAAHLQRIFRTAEPFREEYSFDTSRGRFWHDISLSPVMGEDGRVQSVVGFVRDVTSRRAFQDQLERSREATRALLDATRDVAVLVDAEGRFLAVNARAAQALGHPESELVGKRAYDFFPPDVAQKRRRVAAECLADGRPKHYEEVGYGKVLDVTVYPIRPGRGPVDRLAIYARDITEQRNAEQSIQAARLRALTAREEERRHMARELHDSIGQRMVAMHLSMTAMLGGGDVLPESTAARLGRLAEGCGDLVADVRNICHGLYPPTLESLGLPGGLGQLARQAPDSVAVEVHCGPEAAGCRFPADVEIEVFRVAQEAVSNALRHSGAERIEVQLRYDEGLLMLTVSDDGGGFDPTAVGSEGIGLVTMRERAAAIGGELAVRPHRPGTIVQLRVPAEPVRPPEPQK
jgi:PAS domain S-box-containing protein